MYLCRSASAAAAMRRELQRVGLELIEESPAPHAGLGQPKHRLSVYRKR
jgi:hypothetical protein